MKAFDLEKAKAGAKVVTRDGLPVRILCFDLVGMQPIAAAVKRTEYGNDCERLHTYGFDGRYYTGTTQDKDSSLDLFMAPDKKYSAVWMCRDGRVMCLPFPYDSKDDLEEYLRKQYGLHEFQIVEFEL